MFLFVHMSNDTRRCVMVCLYCFWGFTDACSIISPNLYPIVFVIVTESGMLAMFMDIELFIVLLLVHYCRQSSSCKIVFHCSILQVRCCKVHWCFGVSHLLQFFLNQSVFQMREQSGSSSQRDSIMNVYCPTSPLYSSCGVSGFWLTVTQMFFSIEHVFL